jgi:hypothetical protein
MLLQLRTYLSLPWKILKLFYGKSKKDCSIINDSSQVYGCTSNFFDMTKVVILVTNETVIKADITE